MSWGRVGCTYPVSSTARLCKLAGWPSHDHGKRKRVQAIGRTGSCKTDGVHVAPPSVEMSTRAIRPRPDQAKPEISQKPGPGMRCPPDGKVMTDFASMTK